MSPSPKSLTLVASAPSSALERLLQDRAEAADSVRSLTVVSARLHSEAAAGAALLDELTALAESETAEMKVWAAGGCQGPAPKDKQTERQAIAVRMVGTSATAAAARGAIGDIDAQISAAAERLVTINDQIEQSIFDQVEREHGDVISEYVGVCERGSQLATQISGLALLFRETGNNQRAAAIFATKLPVVSTTPREVQLAADAWSRRIAELRKGSAS
jgi:hypothetical protein